jgi:hypothetical protein
MYAKPQSKTEVTNTETHKNFNTGRNTYHSKDKRGSM